MKIQQQWTIRNFRKLETNTRYCSDEVFTINNCNWKFAVYRGEKDNKYLALYLYVADASNLPKGWSIYAHFTLTAVNQSSREKSETKMMKYNFHEGKVGHGSSSFMRLEVLEEKENGFIRHNKCIVEVEFYVVRPAGLIDFKDLAGIEEPFRPLLKKVFSLYPSMLDFTKNQIPPSRVTAFNDLGRVLKFLKGKKWKDMKDEKSREKLRQLWEKLKSSGLDLRWLESNVKSALDMKGYKTKAEKEKLKQKLEALKEEREELKEKLRGIEKSVKKTAEDLKNAKRFKDLDLDAIIVPKTLR